MNNIGLLSLEQFQKLPMDDKLNLAKNDFGLFLHMSAREDDSNFLRNVKEVTKCSDEMAKKLLIAATKGEYSGFDPELKALSEKAARFVVTHEAGKKFMEWVKEEESDHKEGGLLRGLAGLSHAKQVHALTDHFMHGGSVDDLEKSGYLSKKQAEEVKATNKKVEEEVEAAWKEKEERLKAEGKSQREIEEEKARFKAKETEARLRKESEDAKARGDMHVANTYAAQANAQAMQLKEKTSYETTTTRGVKVESDKLKNNLVEAEKLQAAKNSGVELTAEQNKTVELKNILEEKDFSKKLKAQREIKEELAAKLYKKDATELEKVAALEAVKNGVVTQGVVDKSKAVEENSEKKVSQKEAMKQASIGEDIEDFGSRPAPINKNFLASKREGVEKPTPSNVQTLT